LFEKSYRNGVVPEIWKKANVTPIFKKGKRTDPANYRPVSLTSVLCKLMEKLVRSVIVNHLCENKLLSIHQHGFVNRKSCATNLLETLDIITEALNRGFSAVLVLLDFSKAFDRVLHELLLIKLESYGLNDDLLKWCKSFLTGRKQRVVLGDSVADYVDVISGVPQGSVLGLLFFVLFINDMPELVEHFCKLFADDSKLIAIIRNSFDQKVLQSDLDKLVEWSVKWKLSFNEDKCKIMNIGCSPLGKTFLSMRTCTGEVKTLTESSVERDLGIMINHKLNWKDQVDHAVQKAQNALGLLKRTFKHWDAEMFVKLFTVYVRPHLEYCNVVWSPYRKREIFRLEQVQRRATKLVPQIKFMNYESRLANLGLPTLEWRRQRGDLIQQFKFVKGINRVNWFYGNVSGVDVESVRPSTRSSSNLHHHQMSSQFTRIDRRANFFTNRVVNEWNDLDRSVVSAETVNGFKNRLDNYRKSMQVTVNVSP
jgi:hypothetical protein